MNELTCEVVEDLLPLYYDEVCSTATKEAIEAHLSTCGHCRAALHRLQQNSNLPFEVIRKNKEEVAGLSSFQGYWHRSRVISFVKGLLLATAVCACLLLLYTGLFRWNMMKVPSDVIEITDVSQLKNGKIAYHVRITDGFAVNQINGKMGSDGIFYITPVRPVIKSRKLADIGLSNRYDTIDLEQLNANRSDPSSQIRSIYYGPKDDHPILIWKQGMELPPATPYIEAQFAEQN